MTWTLGALSLGYGVAMADIRITRRRKDSPSARHYEGRFGVAKLRAMTCNSVVGFAGDLQIGLDLTKRLRGMVENQQTAHGGDVNLVIEPDFYPNLLPELSGGYANSYPEEQRANGCSLLVLGVSTTRSLFPGTGGPPLAFGHILKFPKPAQTGIKLESLSPPGRSIGMGNGIAEYRKVLEEATNPTHMWDWYKQVWEFSRLPDMSDAFREFHSRNSLAASARGICTQLSEVINDNSSPSISRNLLYAVVTKDQVAFGANYEDLPKDGWPPILTEWDEVQAMMDTHNIPLTSALMG